MSSWMMLAKAEEVASTHMIRTLDEKRRFVAVGVGLAALAAGVLAAVYTRLGESPVTPELWLTQAPTRSLEARVSDGRADTYRPYDVPRSGSGDAAHRSPSLEGLAELERQQDFHGIAVAWMVRGDWAQAEEYLGRAPPGPDVDSDRALIALGQDRPDEALALVDRALRARPGHAQALWNRGLVLRHLGLPLMAAASFEQVAALAESGWSAEASRIATGLREETRRHKGTWNSALAAGGEMVGKGTPLSAEQVSETPGLARLYLYDAVRAAPSRERVLGLLAVARQLDGIDSGTYLQDYLQRVASRDFTARRPLAETYAKLVLGSLPPGEVPAFLERLRHSQERDILLGALVVSHTVRASLGEYQKLALETGDPWFALLADEQQAEAELDRGEAATVEARLLRAAQRCGERAQWDYRCSRVHRVLTRAYDILHRPLEARQHASEALRRGQRGHDWAMESLVLEELGQIMAHTNKLPLAHAYLEEFLARTDSPDCVYADYVHTTLAMAHQNALDIDGLRAEIDLAAQCDRLPSVLRAGMLADLARLRPRPGDAELLRKSVEAVRAANPPNPGDAALVTSFEGRFELERNRGLGESLLRRAISEAERLPATDVNGRKARAYSYTSLIFEAGKHGEYDAALELFAAELGLALPSRCVLGVTVDDERTLVVLRDATGKTLGTHDSSRTQPISSVTGLVPAELVQALRPCESVAVLARPPIQGLPGLLPSDVAWGYRVGPPPSRPSALPARRLIVMDTEPPEELRQQLPRLESVEVQPSADTTILRGLDATPSRVLEAMGRATEITVHSHGMIDPGISDASFLVLSKQGDGRFALTARAIEETRLEGHPLVLLAACYSGQLTPSLHASFGLPIAFIHAGARTVLAATEQIPNREASPFFEPVLARIRAGEPPAAVLREARLSWLKERGTPWVEKVLLFE